MQSLSVVNRKGKLLYFSTRVIEEKYFFLSGKSIEEKYCTVAFWRSGKQRRVIGARIRPDRVIRKQTKATKIFGVSTK